MRPVWEIFFYRGYGCLAMQGFQGVQYSEGRLLVLDDRNTFAFERDGEFRHVYRRLPSSKT